MNEPENRIVVTVILEGCRPLDLGIDLGGIVDGNALNEALLDKKTTHLKLAIQRHTALALKRAGVIEHMPGVVEMLARADKLDAAGRKTQADKTRRLAEAMDES